MSQALKFIYLISSIIFGVKILLTSNSLPEQLPMAIAKIIVQDSGVPNTVSGIIFHNRLYDTIFEVVVFTISILGTKFLLADEKTVSAIYQIPDQPSIVLARLGATISALVGIELAIRGHLSPGGGFAAGVAGGTALGLLAITSSVTEMQNIYDRQGIATWEKLSVLLFLVLAAINLMGVNIPYGEFGSLISGGWIPIFNIIVAAKVTLGSWAVILLFIRYRGLL